MSAAMNFVFDFFASLGVAIWPSVPNEYIHMKIIAIEIAIPNGIMLPSMYESTRPKISVKRKKMSFSGRGRLSLRLSSSVPSPRQRFQPYHDQ